LKKGGYGGDRTKTGLHFEHKTDLRTALLDYGFTVLNDEVFNEKEKIGQIVSKNELYSKFLKARNVDYLHILSKKLLPDDALFVTLSNTLFIIEKKYQECEGSVDEKLQTCDFKKKQYERLVNPLGINVEVIFVLNDWFKQPKYRDTLNYITETKCHYFFNEIPIEFFERPW
jgi:hypothetical protein